MNNLPRPEYPKFGIENLTENSRDAKRQWEILSYTLDYLGVKVKKRNPTRILDMGGGQGQFAQYVNTKKSGFSCVSLDYQKWKTPKEAHPVRGNMYRLPFPAHSFHLIYVQGSFDS